MSQTKIIALSIAFMGVLVTGFGITWLGMQTMGSDIRGEIAQVRGEIAHVRSEIRIEISALSQRVSTLSQRVSTLAQRVARIEGRLGIPVPPPADRADSEPVKPPSQPDDPAETTVGG